MYFDLNGDGRLTGADFLAAAKDSQVAAMAGELIGFGVLQSATNADDEVVAVASAIIAKANETIQTGNMIRGRAYAQKGIALLQRINELADDGSIGANLASASLAGLEAFVEAYDWENGTQDGEIRQAVGAFLAPVLSGLLAITAG